MKLTFPNEFFWGVSTSAYQIEGGWKEDGKGPSIWDTFTQIPDKIPSKETGEIACDHYHRWPEDLKLLSTLGVNAYRFSIAWTRIFPLGRGKVNVEGLDFYDRLVDGLLSVGIEPFPTLYHWDLPQALQDQGGWPHRATAEAFVEYARAVFRRLSDRVKWWTTHNEPYVAAILGHWLGEHAPGRRAPAEALQAAHHLLLSHGLAVTALRADAPGEVKIGIALNLQPVHPFSQEAADQQAAQRFDGLVNRWFLEPIFHGQYPEDMLEYFGKTAPTTGHNDMKNIGVEVDFLGVNYYSRVVARHNSKSPLVEMEQVEPLNAERSLMWEIYPAGLKELLERLQSNYQPKAILITENGIPLQDNLGATGQVGDTARIAFLTRHLSSAHDAMAAGVALKGYFVWSFLDNFEWALGYQMRFGLVHVDFATQRRIPKASATWYKKVVTQNGLEVEG